MNKLNQLLTNYNYTTQHFILYSIQNAFIEYEHKSVILFDSYNFTISNVLYDFIVK